MLSDILPCTIIFSAIALDKSPKQQVNRVKPSINLGCTACYERRDELIARTLLSRPWQSTRNDFFFPFFLSISNTRYYLRLALPVEIIGLISMDENRHEISRDTVRRIENMKRDATTKRLVTECSFY